MGGLAALVPAGARRKPDRGLLAAGIVAVTLLAVYSYPATWRPLPYGNFRYLAYGAAPLAVLCAGGLNLLRHGRHKRVWAALFLALTRALGVLEEAGSDRIAGVVIGLAFVLVGNSLPMNLEPWSEQRCRPSKTQRFQRFTGWTLVLRDASICPIPRQG